MKESQKYTYKGSPITGIVPLDSPLYVQRAADDICREALRLAKEIKDSVPFIRIKAAKGMGKSSLLVRLHQFLETEQKHAVGYVDLGSDEFDSDVFNDLEKLFYRFTEEIFLAFTKYSTHLNLPSLKFFWRQERTPGANCTNYLHELFKQIKQPKTLIIDGIDRVLGQKTQTDFLNVLRSWNERRMKVVSNAPIVWPSIAIAYSTDPYPDYNLPGSPLYNIGTDVELKEFTPKDVLNLSKIYGLNWSLNESDFLMSLVGGHPNLIILALHKISKENISLNELDRQADLVNGPFGNHLLKFLEMLQKDEELSACFKNIIIEEGSCDEFRTWQLEKVGLIRIEEKGIKVRCELYKRYFMKNLDLKN